MLTLLVAAATASPALPPSMEPALTQMGNVFLPIMVKAFLWSLGAFIGGLVLHRILVTVGLLRCRAGWFGWVGWLIPVAYSIGLSTIAPIVYLAVMLPPAVDQSLGPGGPARAAFEPPLRQVGDFLATFADENGKINIDAAEAKVQARVNGWVAQLPDVKRLPEGSQALVKELRKSVQAAVKEGFGALRKTAGGPVVEVGVMKTFLRAGIFDNIQNWVHDTARWCLNNFLLWAAILVGAPIALVGLINSTIPPPQPAI